MAQVAAVVVAAGQGLRAGGEIPSNFGELQAKRCSNVPCRLLQRP